MLDRDGKVFIVSSHIKVVVEPASDNRDMYRSHLVACVGAGIGSTSTEAVLSLAGGLRNAAGAIEKFINKGEACS